MKGRLNHLGDWRAVALAILTPLLFCGITQAQVTQKLEIVPQIPHSGAIGSVVFASNGAWVLSGGDRTVKLWEAVSGQLIRTFPHTASVRSVALSPDGMQALAGSGDKTLRLWDVASGELVRTFRDHSGPVQSVTFSSDGKWLLSGSTDKTVKLWDLATGQVLRTLSGHSARITSVAFSPDRTRVLSGSADKTLILWDTATGQILRTFTGHSQWISSVAFSPDGERILSGSADKTLKLWDAASGEVARTFQGHSREIYAIAFSPDGARVLSGDLEGALKLWDSGSGQLLHTAKGELGSVKSLAFSPDGTRIMSCDDWTLKLWNASTMAVTRTFGGQSASIYSIAISPDGRRLISGSDDKTLELWDPTSGQLLRTFAGHSQAVSSVAFSTDGSRVLSGSWDKTLKLWDAANGKLLRTFNGHSIVNAGVLSPDSALVLSGSNDKTLELWDSVTGTVLRSFKGHSGTVLSVAFSPDGTHVLSGSSDKTLKLWDASTGQVVRTFEGHTGAVKSVAFSSDGWRILSGSDDKTLKLWHAASGELLRTYQGHTDLVQSVGFSPDNTLIASCGWDNTLKLWDAASGQLIRTLQGHAAPCSSIVFSPISRRLASGGTDTTTRLWDPETGEQLAALIGGGTGDWLAITPAGFFDASRTGTEMLSIVRGLNVTTMDQVHQSLFNPDLVRETLAGDPSGEAAEAAKVTNLEKVLDSGPAPTVAITSPSEGSTSSGDLATLTARIEDRGKGIGRIEWRVNGITAAVAGIPTGSGPVHTVTQQLALDPGDNIVEVVAYNGSNLLASLPARISIKFAGAADVSIKPKLHILAIGINAYVDRGWAPPGSAPLAFAPLALAAKDAAVFANKMSKAAAGLYDEVRVTLALDKDATRDNLDRTIAELAPVIHPRDSFILFAAGHGTSESGRFYLIPQDYQSGPGHLTSYAIGQDRLQDWLANRIKAKRAVILLDTCESGALVAGHARSRTDTPASDAAIGRLHEATGHPVLTAAAAGQFAHEGLIGETGERHGVFTWALLDALRNGDSNGNGLIELSELVRHVQNVVPKIAAGLVRAAIPEPVLGKQAARFGSRGEDFPLAQRLQ